MIEIYNSDILIGKIFLNDFKNLNYSNSNIFGSPLPENQKRIVYSYCNNKKICLMHNQYYMMGIDFHDKLDFLLLGMESLSKALSIGITVNPVIFEIRNIIKKKNYIILKYKFFQFFETIIIKTKSKQYIAITISSKSTNNRWEYIENDSKNDRNSKIIFDW